VVFLATSAIHLKFPQLYPLKNFNAMSLKRGVLKATNNWQTQKYGPVGVEQSTYMYMILQPLFTSSASASVIPLTKSSALSSNLVTTS